MSAQQKGDTFNPIKPIVGLVDRIHSHNEAIKRQNRFNATMDLANRRLEARNLQNNRNFDLATKKHDLALRKQEHVEKMGQLNQASKDWNNKFKQRQYEYQKTQNTVKHRQKNREIAIKKANSDIFKQNAVANRDYAKSGADLNRERTLALRDKRIKDLSQTQSKMNLDKQVDQLNHWRNQEGKL